jgi:hypothetical protein
MLVEIDPQLLLGLALWGALAIVRTVAEAVCTRPVRFALASSSRGSAALGSTRVGSTALPSSTGGGDWRGAYGPDSEVPIAWPAVPGR